MIRRKEESLTNFAFDPLVLMILLPLTKIFSSHSISRGSPTHVAPKDLYLKPKKSAMYTLPNKRLYYFTAAAAARHLMAANMSPTRRFSADSCAMPMAPALFSLFSKRRL